jgi:hypothetical protein
MAYDRPTGLRKKRAPITGLEPDAMLVYGHRPRQNYVREPMTIPEGLARWLDQIGWVIDAPFPKHAIGDDHLSGERSEDELPLYRMAVEEPGVRAEYMKNVIWGLTFADLFQEANSVESLVGFALDGATIDMRSRSKSLNQVSNVRVLVDSVRARMAMDVAMRLWDLLREQPAFSVDSTRLNPMEGGRVKARRPDLTVRRMTVLDEPSYLGTGTASERSQATFRLQVNYIRH